MAKYKVQSVTATFGTTALLVKSCPAGDGKQSDPVDVTTLDDTETKYLPGALVNSKEITLTCQGLTEAPAINTVADLVITAKFNDGNSDTEKKVTVAKCILKEATPPAAEAGGDRSATWDLVFQPGGCVASTAA